MWTHNPAVMSQALTLKEKDRRDRIRFWLEFFGISITILSLLFVGYQIRQQQREIELQTVLQIEDSERFINQLALNKPELSLLLRNAGLVMKTHTMIIDCDFSNYDVRELGFSDNKGLIGPISYRKIENNCKEGNISDDHILEFITNAENLLHLLPVSQITDFYKIDLKEGDRSNRVRFQALRALIEQLRARVDTAGYIMLQEFEKMFRVCGKNIIEKEYWRGENAFEKRMHIQLRTEPLVTMLDNDSMISGFHPDFVSYARKLAGFDSYGDLDPQFKSKHCEFKSDYWLIPYVL